MSTNGLGGVIIYKYVPMTESSCYILLSIANEPKHGYAIMQQIRDITNGSIQMGNGTLYGVLARLSEDGLIKTMQRNEKKIYEITPLGKKTLFNEKKRLETLLENFNFIT